EEGAPSVAVLPLVEAGGELRVTLERRTRTHRNRYALPAVRVAPDGSRAEVDFDRLAALLVAELSAVDTRGPGRPDVLLGRMRESADAVAAFLALRDPEVETLWGPGPLGFADTEQTLLLGHMLHPTPKSRSELGEAYAPEAAARFRLRWLAVDPAL